METETDTERERERKLFTLNLDDQDRDLLDRVSAAEKLTKSDILRIALRRYAKELGLETKPAA